MTPNDSMEVVEIVARALAKFWGVDLEKHPDLIGLQAQIALTAIEASARWRIVPVEPTEAIPTDGASPETPKVRAPK
jgi:hypothetical protein